MFITLEGPEGSGKTSHVPSLVEYLREKGYTVFPTREPGGTSISEQIREVIHSLKNPEMHPHTETLLYQAARAQIVEQVIRPRLAERVRSLFPTAMLIRRLLTRAMVTSRTSKRCAH